MSSAAPKVVQPGAIQDNTTSLSLSVHQGAKQAHAAQKPTLTLKAAPRLSRHSTSRSEWGPAPATLSLGDLAPHIAVKSALNPVSRRCNSLSKRGGSEEGSEDAKGLIFSEKRALMSTEFSVLGRI